MPRAYKDGVELATEEINGRVPGQPEGTCIVNGVYSPGHPDPVPVVLLPGFEYRMRRAVGPSQGVSGVEGREAIWIIERRRTTEG